MEKPKQLGQYQMQNGKPKIKKKQLPQKETLYTEEQVREAIKFGWELSHYFRLKTEDELLLLQRNFIQSLKQPKKD